MRAAQQRSLRDACDTGSASCAKRYPGPRPASLSRPRHPPPRRRRSPGLQRRRPRLPWPSCQGAACWPCRRAGAAAVTAAPCRETHERFAAWLAAGRHSTVRARGWRFLRVRVPFTSSRAWSAAQERGGRPRGVDLCDGGRRPVRRHRGHLLARGAGGRVFDAAEGRRVGSLREDGRREPGASGQGCRPGGREGNERGAEHDDRALRRQLALVGH